MFRNLTASMFNGLKRASGLIARPSRTFCDRPAIAINGLGRIGKCVLREAIRSNANIVAVNQPFADVKAIARSLQFDSVHGVFDRKIEVFENSMQIDGHCVKVFHEEKPESLSWGCIPVDYVIDATGKFTEIDKAMKHINAGAKKVIISAPSKDAPMFVRGVNFDKYVKTMNVVSNSSCTTNCAAPVIKVIHEAFGIKSCHLTTVHAMTASQHVHDGLTGRSGPFNIVLGSTGAAVAVGKVIPELNGIIKGDAARVPVLDVSLLKLFMNLSKNVTVDDIKREIECRSLCDMQGVLNYEINKLVSSDFIGCPYSAVVDFNQIDVIDKLVSIGVWYDNEIGYSNRLLDLINHMAKVDRTSCP